MAGEKKKNRFGKKSLSVRLPLLFAVGFLALAAVILMVVFVRFRQEMMENYERMARGATSMMKDEISGDDVAELMEKGSASPEYVRIANKLMSIYKHYPDIYYLYVYKIDGEGSHVVFDVFKEDGEIRYDEPGAVLPLVEPFSTYRWDIMAGKEIPAYAVVDSTGEYLLSYITPIKDSEGNYVCSACVDFSMMYLYRQDTLFLLEIFVLICVIAAVVSYIIIYLIRRNVTKPLEDISACTSSFSYETEADRIHNVQLLEDLNIRSEDEIGEIYHVFLSVLKDSFYYMSNLEKAKTEIKQKEELINYMGKNIYTDALTGVGNKAAYIDELKKINAEIEKGRENYAVIMADINNLKYVNDTFGHEKGDAYIKGCCDILTKHCAKCPIYRIGGDEFVIILRAHEFDIRQQISAKLMIAFNMAYKNASAEPYERYSASIGMAPYKKSDGSIDATFKRADQLMYEHKQTFKERYGSYR